MKRMHHTRRSDGTTAFPKDFHRSKLGCQKSTAEILQIHISFLGSVQESDRARDFSGVGFTAKTVAVAIVAVGNVETPRLVRVSKLRGTCNNSSVKIPPYVPRSVISTANPQFCPFWCKCRRWRLRKTKMCVSRNPCRTNTFTDCRAEP